MDVMVKVKDLDKDGYPEAIVKKSGGSIRDYISEIKIFRGNENGFEADPCFSTTLKGFTPILKFWDIDGDGRLEMALPLVDIGLTQMARMLLSQSVKMQFRIFRNQGEKGAMYDKNPDLVKKITLKIETEPLFRTLGFTPDLGGDFDGDGLPDLAMAYEKGFGIWKNKGNLNFSTSPFLSMALPPTGIQSLDDLNGDGKCDIYLWDAANPKTSGILNIYMNKH